MTNKKIRVLMIEDNQDEVELARKRLVSVRTPISLESELTLAGGLERIKAESEIDAVLLDLGLPDSSGIETFEKIHAQNPKLPIVILTVTDEEELALSAVQKGAQDYLIKNHLDSEVLKRSILYAIERKQVEISLEKVRQEQLKANKLESIGLLAGGIAHDFNNLLTIIQGHVTLLEIDKLNREVHSQKIEEALYRAKFLTQQLITFSKGGSPIKRPTPVEALIREAVAIAISGSNVKAEFEFPQNPWLADLDKDQFRQALMNIVNNAKEAMPDGGTIKIKVENREPDKKAASEVASSRSIRISIQDEGAGIPQESLQKIFDPYFTTKPGKSGLGLAGAFSIVKSHGGALSAESEPGKGCTFHIDFHAAKPEAHQAVENKPEGMQRSKAGARILIMDDEKLLVDFLASILRHLGYVAETSSNYEEAIMSYKAALQFRNPFSAVILDLTIPGGKGGKETLEALKKINPNVKAIVSSGYADDPIMANYKNYGFSAVLVKPYSAVELSQILRSVIGEDSGNGKMAA